MTVVAQPLSRLLIRLKSVSILTCVDSDKQSLCMPMVIEEIYENLLELCLSPRVSCNLQLQHPLCEIQGQQVAVKT